MPGSDPTSRTVIDAIYDHGGEIEVTESCANCQRNHSYLRDTAQRTRPSSSSSSSYSDSSSGFAGGSSDGGGGSRW